MVFANIPGLRAAKRRLIDAFAAHRPAHAQLFIGPEGALTLPLALAYATYLHCENKQEDDACGSCRACRQSQKYSHPDTHFIFPQTHTNTKGDGEDSAAHDELKLWRSFLSEQPFGRSDDWLKYCKADRKQAIISREQARSLMRIMTLKAFAGPYKVAVFWQPELMHPAAANSLLKIIEEPPAGSFFLLASTDDRAELPLTLRSRLLEAVTPLLSDEELSNFLKQRTHTSDERLAAAVQLADGNLHQALAFVEDGHLLNPSQFIEWMRACFKQDYGALIDLAEAFHQLDKLNQQNMLRYSLSILREALLCLANAASIRRATAEEWKDIERLSKTLNLDRIETLHSLLSEAAHHLIRNGSAKMIFLSLSLRIADLLNAVRS